MKEILLVDDDIQVLQSFAQLFNDAGYTVMTAECGAAALRMLESHPVDIFISDMHMPEMSGYSLLQEVKSLYPDMFRIILCDFTDERSVTMALHQNIAKIFIFKPWNNEDLLNLIQRLFETREVLKGSSLLSLINNCDELPTIHSSYSRIISMIDGDLDFAKIALAIEQDQSITTKVLHMANSAYFGVKTGSVKHAVTYLGLQNIRNLVMTTSIIDAVYIKGIGSMFFTRLWNHAFLTNRILTMLYDRFIQKKLPEASSSAGLLHNIGIGFFLKAFPDKYMGLIRATEKDKRPLLEQEREAFNTVHSEVGGYLLYWWELPFPMIESALYYHQPFDERIINKDLVMAVHIAQKYAFDKTGGVQYCNFDARTFDALNINRNEFEAAVGSVGPMYARV